MVAALAVAGGVYAATSGGGNSGSGNAAAGAGVAAGATATQGAAATSAPAGGDASASASPVASTAKPLAMIIPTAAGGLALLNNSVGDQVKSALSQADSSQPGLESALFGAYSLSGSSSYFANLTLVELSDGSASGYESLYTSMGPISALLNIEGTNGPSNTTQETPANSGGAMLCGDSVSGKVTLHLCTWIDATEYGLAVFSSSVSFAQADRYSLALWKASEHR